MGEVLTHTLAAGDGFIDRSLYESDNELKKVDELLSSPALVKPFEEVFDKSMGRPGTAVGIYLRKVSEVSLGTELRRSGDGG